MKKFYYVLLAFLMLNMLNAQIINFNSPEYKAKLLSANTSGPNAIAKDAQGNFIIIDSNPVDGEISQAEALNVSWLDISNANPNTRNLDWLNYFSNITYLNCSNNAIYCLNLTKLIKLTNLNCSNNNIYSLLIKNGGAINNLNFSGNSGINYICGNSGDVASIQTQINSLGYTSCSINSDCPDVNQCGDSYSEVDLRVTKEIINPLGGAGVLPGGVVTYKLTMTNNGVGLDNLEIIDRIPNPGNHTYSSLVNNGGYITYGPPVPLTCDFAMTLLPPSVPNCTVSYTTTPNICYLNLNSGSSLQPCNNGMWSTSLNANAAKGVKFTFNPNIVLGYGQTRTITYQALVPLTAPAGSKVCNTALVTSHYINNIYGGPEGESNQACITVLPSANNCDIIADFAIKKECKGGKIQITTGGGYTVTNVTHTWALMQVPCGATTGGTMVGAIQTTSNGTFTLPISSPTICYYIKHTVQRVGCPVKEFVVTLDNSVTTLVGNANFQLITTGNTNSPTYTIVVVPTTGSGTDEWYVLSSPNPTGGPYTPLTSYTGVFSSYTATNGLYYTVVHKLKNECGEACSSQIAYRKVNEADCCLASQYWANGVGTPQSLNASFNIGVTLTGQIQTVSTGTTNPNVTNEWYLLSSPTANAGPYTLLLTQTLPINNYTALNGVYYFVIHKVKSTCGEICYGQSICRNCGVNRQPIIGVINCNILDNITLEANTCKTPEKPISNCDKKELSWTGNPQAVYYQVEITFNDPKCCKTNLKPSIKIFETDLEYLNLETIIKENYNCFSWRVRANCSRKTKQFSDWSESNCFTCLVINPRKLTEKTEALNLKNQVINKPTVSPNPNNGVMELEMKTKNELILSVDVFNSSGILIKSISEARYSDGIFINQLDLKSVSKGLYLLIFKTNYGIFNEKVIIN